MRRVLAAEAAQYVGQRVRLAGWLFQLRRMGGINFLLLRDRTGIIQVVVGDPARLEVLAGLQAETILQVVGTVVAEPRARLGVEVHDPVLSVLAPVTDVLPFEINKKILRPSLDVFLDNAAVGLRHPRKQSVFRLGAGLLAAFADYFVAHDFVQIRTPKIVAAATEGGANLFAVDYFGRPAYLAQSPQLYKQIMVGVFERVFEIGPAFRAEPHYTTRHINEFTSIDAEMGFIDGFGDLMDLLADLLRSVLEQVSRTHRTELDDVGLPLPRMDEVPVVEFREAQEIILRRFGEDCRRELDLSPQHERWLCEWAVQERGSEFVFVTHYPTSKRPFYTLPDPADPKHSLSFDLLFRGAELVTGGQRINDYRQLVDSMVARGIDPAGFAGYLEAFEYGMPPEGGFAIGYERLLARLTGAENIRETTLFPRDVNRLTP